MTSNIYKNNSIFVLKTKDNIKMKKIFCVFSVAVIIIAACQPKTKIVPVDAEAAKALISGLLDKYNSAFKAKDTNTLIASLTSDVLACGTDPSEFWDKKQIADGWTQAFADTSLKINYSIDKREIRLSADGNSALVVEQYIMSLLSSKIPIRSVYHTVKVDGNWMLDFISWNFIPKNEDISKLNKALE
jgi:ketosteroid isomerase-like protein